MKYYITYNGYIDIQENDTKIFFIKSKLATKDSIFYWVGTTDSDFSLYNLSEVLHHFCILKKFLEKNATYFYGIDITSLRIKVLE